MNTLKHLHNLLKTYVINASCLRSRSVTIILWILLRFSPFITKVLFWWNVGDSIGILCLHLYFLHNNFCIASLLNLFHWSTEICSPVPAGNQSHAFCFRSHNTTTRLCTRGTQKAVCIQRMGQAPALPARCMGGQLRRKLLLHHQLQLLGLSSLSGWLLYSTHTDGNQALPQAAPSQEGETNPRTVNEMTSQLVSDMQHAACPNIQNNSGFVWCLIVLTA